MADGVAGAGDYDIQPATPADLEKVQAVLKATWHATYDAALGYRAVECITESWHALHALEAQGLREGYVRLVARAGRDIVGTSGATLAAGGLLELNQIYILPAHQGRGLGRALFRETLARFPSARRIGLEVEAHNTRAIAVYEGWGFRCIGQVDDCGVSGSGVQALVYVKDLV